jgi:flagellar basal-body rod protein FlgF
LLFLLGYYFGLMFAGTFWSPAYRLCREVGLDNAVYVGLSRQMTLRRELDVIANNIANADTAGFKLESLLTRQEQARPASGMDGPHPVTFVLDDKVARDFRQGTVHRTDGPLDLAINGQGFFKVSTPDGERYTRDGSFTMSPDGRLVTHQGAAVLDEGGGEITLDPLLGEVSIGKDGTVSQSGQNRGRVALVQFQDLTALDKSGDNLFKNTSNLQPEPATTSSILQGNLESSNVNTVLQVTRLIEVSRTYESVTKMLNSTSELDRSAIQRLGKVA